MNCRRIKKMFSAYLDGDLSTKERQTVENHLSSCAQCQREWRLYKKSWERLGQWENIEPHPYFISRFWTKIATKTPRHRRGREKILTGGQMLFRRRRLVYVFATACLFFIISTVSVPIYLKHKSTVLLAGLSEDAWAMVENYELLRDYEIVENIDFLEELYLRENEGS